MEEDLRRYRRQRAMNHLEAAIYEANRAAEHAVETRWIAPSFTLAYQLEHARTALELLSVAITLPASGSDWLATYGEDVRLFRNRLDHYDEDMKAKHSLEEQAKFSIGVAMGISSAGLSLQIRGKARHYSLKASHALNDLIGVYSELKQLGQDHWRAELL